MKLRLWADSLDKNNVWYVYRIVNYPEKVDGSLKKSWSFLTYT